MTDLRSELKKIEGWGELLRIPREVDPRFELPAVAKRLENGQGLLFERVKGYPQPVAVGFNNSRLRIARLLGTDEFNLTQTFLQAIRTPITPLLVESGPVKQEKITSGVNLPGLLPVITHYEKDAGPYITAGLVIAEDKENKIRNLSYHRLQLLGKDEFSLFMSPRQLWNLYSQKEKEGKPLEAAVVLGLDAGIRLAGATPSSLIPFGFDKLSIAGALRKQAVEIVPCETIKVHVPATAEIVLEGEILPGLRRKEGPCADFTGSYSPVSEAPVFKTKAVTHRQNPIYQDLLPFSPEHHLLLAVPQEPALFQAIKKSLPEIKAVNLTPSGCGRFHAVIGMKKKHEGEGKDAILVALSAMRDLKFVIVVDDDVNPYSPREVEWAVATRFQANRDLVVLSGVTGNEYDPSCSQKGLTAKMGIDATKPPQDNIHYDRVRIPKIEDIKVEDYLEP